jgi:hypothetical protein
MLEFLQAVKQDSSISGIPFAANEDCLVPGTALA